MASGFQVLRSPYIYYWCSTQENKFFVVICLAPIYPWLRFVLWQFRIGKWDTWCASHRGVAWQQELFRLHESKFSLFTEDWVNTAQFSDLNQLIDIYANVLSLDAGNARLLKDFQLLRVFRFKARKPERCDGQQFCSTCVLQSYPSNAIKWGTSELTPNQMEKVILFGVLSEEALSSSAESQSKVTSELAIPFVELHCSGQKSALLLVWAPYWIAAFCHVQALTWNNRTALNTLYSLLRSIWPQESWILNIFLGKSDGEYISLRKALSSTDTGIGTWHLETRFSPKAELPPHTKDENKSCKFVKISQNDNTTQTNWLYLEPITRVTSLSWGRVQMNTRLAWQVWQKAICLPSGLSTAGSL